MSKVKVFAEATDTDVLFVENTGLNDSNLYVLPKQEIISQRAKKVSSFIGISGLVLCLVSCIVFLLIKRVDNLIPIENKFYDNVVNVFFAAPLIALVIWLFFALKNYYKKISETSWENSCRIVLRRKNGFSFVSGVDYFPITDKMFFTGLEGDFVTFYKGELMKKSLMSEKNQ